MAVREVGTLTASRRLERGSVTLLPDPDPAPIFCPIVSTDDHVLKPLDLFVARVADKYRDAVPYVEFDDDDVPYWIIGDIRLPIMEINGAAGRPLAEVSFAASKFDEFRRGVWDSAARVKDMDHIGAHASICFPSVIFGFAGTLLSKLRDPEAALAAVRAYNTWHLEEWCGAAPDRYIPCQIPWLVDPVVAADEIRRNAARGFKCVSFSENPENLGFASLYSGEWEPFFQACEETGTVINLHVGSSGAITQPSVDSPAEVTMSLFPVNGMSALADWVYTKIPIRYPGLRIVLSEAGVAWVPMMIDKIGRAYRLREASLVWLEDDPDPADVIRRNFRFTSIEDPSVWRSLDLIGEDVVMVESDYPHQDSTWPDTQQIIRSQLSGLDPSVVRKLCYQNACDLYRHSLPPAQMIALSEIGAP